MPDTGHEPMTPVKRALLEIRELRARLDESEKAKREPVAIVGMALRLPGRIASPSAFWDLLTAGRDVIQEVPPNRWDAGEFLDPDPERRGKMYDCHGGFLDDVDAFDAEFFGITPREAESMDPQQRLLLEVVWEAIENAAIAPAELAGSRTGVFVGLSNSDYARQLLRDAREMDAYASLGSAWSMAAGRLSYLLGVHGPSLVVDTACSSSLTAVHLACQSLRQGESSTVIVGAANLILSPELNVGFSKARMLAHDGRCKTFDSTADGYVRGEGCAAVVLKRLSDAKQAGDRILAVIRGSAVNQDGRSAGITAPNGPAQEQVIRAALDNTGVLPAEVDYVEAHGTGTPLGDPIELRALSAAYCKDRPAHQPLRTGSVKTNLGHLEAAAGLAGLIKVLLMLEHHAIPPHLHLTERNPYVDWEASRIEVPTSVVPWNGEGAVRRAAVSAFGFSGTNAHIVVEEFAPAKKEEEDRGQADHVLCLSAKSEPALRELAKLYETALSTTDASLADVCFTAATGRAHHRHRLTVRAGTRDQMREQLAHWRAGEAMAGTRTGVVNEGPAPVAFVFSGDSAMPEEQIRELSEVFPVFRNVIERNPESNSRAFTVQLALAELWRSWGIEPTVVVGCGVGELVAACVAGVFSVEDAQQLEPGHRSNGTDVDGMFFTPPRIGFVSSITGKQENQFVCTPTYWRRQAQESANLDAGVRCILDKGPHVLLEMALESGKSAVTAVLERLQSLYIKGVAVDWSAFYRHEPRRKVALPTYPFQRQRYWRGPTPASVRMAERKALWDQAAAAALRQSETGPLGWNVGAYSAKWACLERLTSAQIRRVLVELGAFRRAGESYTMGEFLQRFGIPAAHGRLMARWLRGLTGEFLEQKGERFVCRRSPEPVDVAPYWRETEQLLADDPAALAYLRQCCNKLASVIAGRESPLETLFPGGSFELAEGLYERSLEAQYINPIAAAAVERAARQLAVRRDVRVLEVGAGTGGTSSALLQVLPSDRSEYWLTDVSDQFLARARNKFGQYSFVRYARLDLGVALDQQGFAAGTFDIVVAANVVHAMRDIRLALTALRRLLRPGCILVLLESTEHHRWFDISTGLLEGWQHFDDADRQDHPLLRAGEWVDLLKQSGFGKAERFPRRGSPAEAVGQHVVIAQAPAGEIEKPLLAAAVMPDWTPAGPMEQHAPAADFLTELTGAPDAERRRMMTEYVRSCIVQVLRLEPGSVPALRDRLSDLGMDSLMALELRTVLARGLQLGDRLPSTIAFDTGTVEELTNALLVAVFGPSQEPVGSARTAVARPLKVEEIDALSDEEVAVLLKERLRIG